MRVRTDQTLSRRTVTRTTGRMTAVWSGAASFVQTGLLDKRSAVLVVLGFATLVARLHELVPGLRYIKPVILLVGALLLSTNGTLTARRERLIPADDPTFKLMLAYWAWMAVSVPMSLLRSLSLEVTVNLAPVILFAMLVMVQTPSLAQLRYITRGYLVVCVIFTVALFVFGTAVLDGVSLRYTLPGSLDPNDSAAILAIGATISFALARQKGTGRWRVYSLFALGMSVLGLLRTGSRGGMIACAAGLFVIALSGRGVRIAIAMAVFAIVALTVRQVAPPELLGRFAVIGNEENDYNMNSYGGRWQIWQRGVGYFIENPVLGVGVDAFRTREGIELENNGMRGKWSAPHNSYVQSFAELGAVGGVLFISLLVMSIRRCLPFYRNPSPVSGSNHPEYVAAVVCFAVSAFFLSHAYFWGFFALIGLCALASRTLAGTPVSAVARTGGRR